MKNIWLVKILMSPYVLILGLFMALKAQLPHAQYVFFTIMPQHANVDGLQQSNFYAFVVEGLIAVFVVYHKNGLSYLFACVSVATNVAYYQLGGVNMFDPGTQNIWVYWLFSVILPVAIASLTHIFAESLGDTQVLASLQAPTSFDWRKLLAGIQTVKLGFAIEWVSSLRNKQATQAEVVTVVPTSQVDASAVQVLASPTQATGEIDAKYLPVLAALAQAGDKARAGQLAKATGLSQTTLFRTREGTGWLVDLVKLNRVEMVTSEDGTFFSLKGHYGQE